MYTTPTRTRSRRPRRALPCRLLLEHLEDRLPPGDTALAGLLASELVPAGRAAGLALADVRAARPGPARPLAEMQDFAVLPGRIDEARDFLLVMSDRPSTHSADIPDEELFAHPATAVRAGITSPVHSEPGLTSDAVTPSSNPGTDSVAAGIITNLASANYQLDQAAAVLARVADPDGRPAPDLDSGAGVQSSGVRALFDLGHPPTGTFPSNVFTVPDRTQNTDRRVNMPFPDCQVYVSDCEDIAVLNGLDGFNLQPRLSVPFDGPIDVNSVTRSTMFLVSLGSTVPGQGYMPRGTVVGINQVVWDVATNTLHVESDELLAQHTRFALIVTNGVRDADGDPVEASREFRRFRQTVDGPYKRELLDGIHEARRLGVRERDIVTASVFTTQGATAVLEKIRDQIHAATPKPADFLLGPKGERTVFPFADQTNIVWRQQTGDNPPSFTPVNFNLAALRVVPGAVGQLAFGKFVSPNYLTPEVFIPPVGTRTGTPRVQGMNEIYFNLILPSGPKPAEGWPVAIYGHGGGGNKQVFSVGAVLAAQGVATIYLNAVGSGFGPLGTLTVNQGAGSPVNFSAGGRSFDQNGDGQITASEGAFAPAPWTILRGADGIRQLAADFMQLVRVMDVGVDVEGDGARDLDPARAYYFGGSFGGNYGTTFLAVEPNVAAGILNVPAVLNLAEGSRSSPGTRPLLGTWLAERTPPLLNPPGITGIEGVPVGPPHFNENKPLRDGASYAVRLADGTSTEIRSPVVNTAEGAMAIQQWLENSEWARMSGDGIAYAPHLRRAPLAGVPAKSLIVQFAKGDQSAVNPAVTALLRAGNLADRATYYRHDLAFAEDPTLPKNPHGFIGSITSTNPLLASIARGYQEQAAAFFASDGKETIHPEPARFFEVPLRGPLPEGLTFIP